MAVKCPQCNEQINRINGADISIPLGLGKAPLNGMVFSCPRCRAVLGCQIIDDDTEDDTEDE